tara:strand:- start:2 stop:970 length:969 start_codon:yes stop_codon:yes gene_type:complete
MGFFGGERAVLNEMPSAWETARTKKGIGDSRAQMFIGEGGLFRMQYGSHAAVTIADLTGNQTAAATVPTGAIFQWVTNTAPNGYLLCDGSVISSATYSALYGVLGTTYGESSGGGFKLPNLAGRVPIGAGQPDYYEPFKGSLHVGAKGGELGVELTSRHLPEHSHSLDFESSDPYDVSDGTINPTHSHDGTTGFTGQSGTSSSDDTGGSDTGGMTAWNYISMDTVHSGGSVWPFTSTTYQPDYNIMIAGPAGYAYNPTFDAGGSTEHTHFTDLGSHTHTLGGDPATHYHKVDGARTGFSGGSIPEKVDTTPPYLVVNFIIKI